MSKNAWTAALLFAVPWTFFMLIFNSIIRGGISVDIVLSTLFGGLVAGLLFGVLMQYSAKKLYTKINIDIPDYECVIKEGGANHFKGKEGVGGKLVLTDKRLIFKSHKFNIQNHQEDFELNQITDLHTFKSLKFFEKGLLIDLAGGVSHKFIVDEPNDWINVIALQKQ